MFYFELEVSLSWLSPRIWRRFLLHGESTFFDLHEAIQRGFDWESCHLWEFSDERAKPLAGVAHDELERGSVDAKTYLLMDYFGEPKEPGARICSYVYDFGDHWEHQVVLRGFVEGDEEDVAWQRRLLDGEHAGPFEDCGGPPGFERLLKAKKTGVDPWGDEVKALLRHYDFKRIEKFSIEGLKKAFNQRYKARRGPALPRRPKPQEGSAKLDALIQTYIDRLKAKPDLKLEPYQLEVFTLLERCFVLGGDVGHVQLQCEAWALLLEDASLKAKKPEVYAATLFYAIEKMFSTAPFSQREIAQIYGVTVASISGLYKDVHTGLGAHEAALTALCAELFDAEDEGEAFGDGEASPTALVLQALQAQSDVPDEEQALFNAMISFMTQLEASERAGLSKDAREAQFQDLKQQLVAAEPAPKPPKKSEAKGKEKKKKP